jgi:hypothetical protein
MRALVAAVLVASCATAAISPPPERLAGCWIDRKADNTAITMRWLPQSSETAVLRGERLTYGPTGVISDRASYELSPEGAGWKLCVVSDPNAPRCYQVAEGESGSLEGGRAFVDAHGDRLRISIFADSVERITFQGVRDGCD